MSNDKDLIGNANGFGFINPCFKEDELNIEFTAITQTGPLVDNFTKKIMTEFNKQQEVLNLSDRAITVGHDDVSLHNSNNEVPCKLDHLVGKGYGFSNGPWVAETPYIQRDRNMTLGRGLTASILMIDDALFLHITPKLTKTICYYFYWNMVNKGLLKSTDYVIRKQNVRNRIVFNHTHNTNPLMRKLYKLFIKELKQVDNVMCLLYKYNDVNDQLLDDFVTELYIKNNKRFSKRFSDIKCRPDKRLEHMEYYSLTTD